MNVGPIGRLGRYTATHFRVVLVGWLVVAVVLGFFAPRVETALSGAGWETTGSQSVQARQLIDKNFHGLSSYALMTVVYSPTKTVNDPAFQAAIASVERHAARRPSPSAASCAPRRGRLDLPRRPHRDRAGRRGARAPTRWSAAADSLKGKLHALCRPRRAGASDRRVGHVV